MTSKLSPYVILVVEKNLELRYADYLAKLGLKPDFSLTVFTPPPVTQSPDSRRRLIVQGFFPVVTRETTNPFNYIKRAFDKIEI
mgnify:CR=1 FL=1